MTFSLNARETLEYLTTNPVFSPSHTLLEKKQPVYESINARKALKENQRERGWWSDQR